MTQQTTIQQAYVGRVYENRGLPALIDLVDRRYSTVLDIGCGNGANMQMLARRGHRVIGLTISEDEARICHARSLPCVVADITRGFPFGPRSLDAIVCSHVLEHLPFSSEVLAQALGLLKPGGGVYVALPNVLLLQQRWQFMLGRFRYTEVGVMDRTHLRFFDFISARRLLEDAGVRVTHHFGVGQFPLRPIRRVFPGFAGRVDRFVSKRWPGLFAFHIVLAGTYEAD